MSKKEKAIPEKNIKNIAKGRLSSYFAFMTSFLIAAIIIFTMGFVFNHIKNLAMEYEANLKSFNYSLSALLGKTFDEAYEQDSIYKIVKTIDNFKARGMILYIYAVDSQTDRVFYSTDSDILNQTAQSAKKDLFLKYQGKDTLETSSSTKNYTLYIGMPVEKIAVSHLNALLKKVKIFIVLSLFVGVIASAIMSRIVLNPINELTKGV